MKRRHSPSPPHTRGGNTEKFLYLRHPDKKSPSKSSIDRIVPTLASLLKDYSGPPEAFDCFGADEVLATNTSA
jgi:hypothetical protein